MAIGPAQRVEVFGTTLRKALATLQAPEPAKLGRGLHSLGVVHHEGRMVLPAQAGGMQLQQQLAVCRAENALKGSSESSGNLLKGYERLRAGALRCWEAEAVSEPLQGRFC